MMNCSRQDFGGVVAIRTGMGRLRWNSRKIELSNLTSACIGRHLSCASLNMHFCRDGAAIIVSFAPKECSENIYAFMTYLSCDYDGMALRLGSITLGLKGVWAGLNGQSRGARSEQI